MDVLRERTEPHQAVGDPDDLRLRDLDQAEAGRDDVHFLFSSYYGGQGGREPGLEFRRHETPRSFGRDRTLLDPGEFET